MNIFSFLNKKEKAVVVQDVPAVQPVSAISSGVSSPWYGIRTEPFDGEKTPGEMGNVINLVPEHHSLRLRAFEAELKSDVVKIITGKFLSLIHI